MPTDVEVCQTNPAAFFSFGPYAWQPFGVLIQNRSNISLYANEGTYCDENNFRFVVPPYYQGAFLVSGNQISFKFDKNGTLGPIPSLERATIFITDTFISPGLFPYAATVRDTLNAANATSGTISGGGSLTANFPTIAPGLYEVYGWGATLYDVQEIEGDVFAFRATLSLNGIAGVFDVLFGNNGGRQKGYNSYDLSSFGTGMLGTTGVGGTFTLTFPNLANSTRYMIAGWGCAVQDVVGTAGDDRVIQAQLNHVGAGSLGLLDFDLIANGGRPATGQRQAVRTVNRVFDKPLEVTTPNNVTNFDIVANMTAATASSQNVQVWLRAAPMTGIATSDRILVSTAQRVFSPPLLIQVTQNTNFQVIATPIGIPQAAQNLDASVFYAPLRF